MLVFSYFSSPFPKTCEVVLRADCHSWVRVGKCASPEWQTWPWVWSLSHLAPSSWCLVVGGGKKLSFWSWPPKSLGSAFRAAPQQGTHFPACVCVVFRKEHRIYLTLRFPSNKKKQSRKTEVFEPFSLKILYYTSKGKKQVVWFLTTFWLVWH